MKSLIPLTLAASLALATSAKATEEADAFVDANILSIFYHELGHAVIDLMNVPIFGQEEDAADVMAVLLIDELFNEDSAQDIAYDSAFGYINDPSGQMDVAYWDLHGPDEQRFYNHVCLFFGANPDDRAELAADLGLPEERADYCPEEYEQAIGSWGQIFDEMKDLSSGATMVFEPGNGKDAAPINRLLAEEIKALNVDFKLPQPVTVRVQPCDEPNAFYDPSEVSITFCQEFVAHLRLILVQLSE